MHFYAHDTTLILHYRWQEQVREGGINSRSSCTCPQPVPSHRDCQLQTTCTACAGCTGVQGVRRLVATVWWQHCCAGPGDCTHSQTPGHLPEQRRKNQILFLWWKYFSWMVVKGWHSGLMFNILKAFLEGGAEGLALYLMVWPLDPSVVWVGEIISFFWWELTISWNIVLEPV